MRESTHKVSLTEHSHGPPVSCFAAHSQGLVLWPIFWVDPGKEARVFLCHVETCILCFIGVLEEAKFFGISKAIEPLEAMVQVDAYTCSLHILG